jgi:3-deoxy-D-manno-octulosonate 8-phosphate phosphatase (KDO 8-P phosphatase)
MHEFTPELSARARQIRLLALDVDGVLTDGRITYSDRGVELKSFSILDGLGIKLLQSAGIRVAIITARQSSIVQRRATELGIDYCIQGCKDKLEALLGILASNGIELAETAYIGDDLPDLAAMLATGLPLTVANAAHDVAMHACWQSRARGGDGAVREACEALLRARGEWDRVIAPFLRSRPASR